MPVHALFQSWAGTWLEPPTFYDLAGELPHMSLMGFIPTDVSSKCFKVNNHKPLSHGNSYQFIWDPSIISLADNSIHAQTRLNLKLASQKCRAWSDCTILCSLVWLYTGGKMQRWLITFGSSRVKVKIIKLLKANCFCMLPNSIVNLLSWNLTSSKY